MVADENENENASDAPEENEQPAVAPVVTPADAPADAPEPAAPVLHRVQPGESWEVLAALHNVAVEVLHALNADRPHFSERSLTVNQDVRVE